MICPKCGKEIPDESSFCAQCGCDLKKNASLSSDSTSEEQIPIVLIYKQIAKHKIAFVVIVIFILTSLISYIAIKKHQEKKKAETELIESYNHLMSIVGSYQTNDDIKLVLDVDNTAVIIIDYGGYREKKYKGYWREKLDNLIEINFSDSFEIYIGNKRYSYCNTLYLFNGRLWESMSAIRAQDYYASEHVVKK